MHFRRERHFHETRRAFALIGTREKQHVVDDRAHVFELFEIRLQRMTQFVDGTIARQRHFRLADENGDRRVQFVRDIRIERFEPPISVIDTFERAVESLG